MTMCRRRPVTACLFDVRRRKPHPRRCSRGSSHPGVAGPCGAMSGDRRAVDRGTTAHDDPAVSSALSVVERDLDRDQHLVVRIRRDARRDCDDAERRSRLHAGVEAGDELVADVGDPYPASTWLRREQTPRALRASTSRRRMRSTSPDRRRACAAPGDLARGRSPSCSDYVPIRVRETGYTCVVSDLAISPRIRGLQAAVH